MPFTSALMSLAMMTAVASAAPDLSVALATGDCATAIAMNGDGTGTSLGERIAIARCHLASGDAASALDTLGTLGSAPLTAHAQAVEGAAWLELGQPIEAVQSLQKAIDDPRLRNPLREQAQLWLSRALIGIDDPGGAETRLKKLLNGSLASAGRLPSPGGVDPGEVRWWLAEAVRRVDGEDAARPIWQAIWSRNPTSAYSPRAAESLKGIGLPVPNPGSTAGQDLMHQRIRTLEKLFRYEEALALRDQLPAGHRLASNKALALASFKAKDYPRSAKLLSAFSSPTPDDQLHLALARVRSGDYDGSNAVYRKMAVPGHGMHELATWKLGYMAYDAGEYARAETELVAYLDRFPAGRYADTALWYRAMGFIQRGDMQQASSVLSQVMKQHGGSSLVPGARYWVARIQDLSGNSAGAHSGYADVLKRWPVSGYAWFAAQRLGKRFVAKPIAKPPAFPSSLQTEDWTIGTALVEAGLLAWARPHLERLIPAAKQAGKDASLALAHTLARAGAYKAAIRLARSHCTKPWKGGDPVAMQACHPGPPHIPLTVSGIPANLPFAIMTAESALRPEVTSPAGARGLMQLMPKLAAELHEERFGSERAFDADDLFMPLYNATLGTDELERLWAGTNSYPDAGIDPHLPFTIGGYNGGIEAVKRWEKAMGAGVEADLYTENIGYTETRRYVRRVLGYLMTYRYIYGQR